jgi:flagellar export protein FliJ
MKAFFFRLERLLHVRAQSERTRARDLARAALHQEEQRDVLDAAASQLDRVSRQLTALPGTVRPAGTLHHLGLAVTAVGEAVRRAQDALSEADAVVESERERFQAAHRERRAVERLRELRQAAWHADATRQLQKEQDEIASVRHARRTEP